MEGILPNNTDANVWVCRAHVTLSIDKYAHAWGYMVQVCKKYCPIPGLAGPCASGETVA